MLSLTLVISFSCKSQMVGMTYYSRGVITDALCSFTALSISLLQYSDTEFKKVNCDTWKQIKSWSNETMKLNWCGISI